MATKTRIDELLVARGLVPTRSQARALIMAGKVLVHDAPVDKAGVRVAADAPIRLKEVGRYVGRGGLKLEKALAEFQIDVTGGVCLDVGQSTGGFTDCLLQHGARKVYGIDVGENQLDWKLRSDARVVCYEKENFRHFDISKISDCIDLAVMDASFISIRLLLPKIVEIFRLHPGRHGLVTLIKPQFEAGREHIGKGGIVRDPEVRAAVVAELSGFAEGLGFTDLKVIPSPITGTDGNVEFLLGAAFITQ